jgi:hypothetical protein
VNWNSSSAISCKLACRWDSSSDTPHSRLRGLQYQVSSAPMLPAGASVAAQTQSIHNVQYRGPSDRNSSSATGQRKPPAGGSVAVRHRHRHNQSRIASPSEPGTAVARVNDIKRPQMQWYKASMTCGTVCEGTLPSRHSLYFFS